MISLNLFNWIQKDPWRTPQQSTDFNGSFFLLSAKVSHDAISIITKWLYVKPCSFAIFLQTPIHDQSLYIFWLSVDAGSNQEVTSIHTRRRQNFFSSPVCSCLVSQKIYYQFNLESYHIITRSPCCHLNYSCPSAKHGVYESPYTKF